MKIGYGRRVIASAGNMTKSYVLHTGVKASTQWPVSCPIVHPVSKVAISARSAAAIPCLSLSGLCFVWDPPVFFARSSKRATAFISRRPIKGIPGETLPFEAVQEQIAMRLKATVEARALRLYVSVLAGQADVIGVDLQGAETPLVQ